MAIVSSSAGSLGPRRTLAQVPIGQKARIWGTREVNAEVLRLVELGLTPGTEVEVVRRAPLGGPLQIRVRFTRLCLRWPDADRFIVEALS